MVDESKLRFVNADEWVRREGRHIVMGLTEFCLQRLGDAVHVEMPEPDDHHYDAGEELGVVQSLRTAVEYHAPVAGVISRINTKLLSRPEVMNADPFGEGWIVEMKPDDIGEIEGLMDIHEYEGGLPEEDEE